LIVLTIIFVGSLLWLSDISLNRQLNQLVQADSDALVEYYEIGGATKLTELLKYRIKTNPELESIYLLTNKDFQTVLGNIPEWPKDIPYDATWGEIDWQAEDIRFDLRYYHRVLSDGKHLLVGRVNDQIENFEDQVHDILEITLLTSLVAGAVVGWFFNYRLKKRFKLIEETCQKISGGQLSHRMAYHDDGDEIDQIAQTLNTMLDRVQVLMDGIQHVTNNVAHDLRTPLTRLRSRLESLQKEVSEPAATSLQASVQDVDELLSTFQSLLNISRIETGQIRKDFSAVNIKALCHDAIELYEPLAEEKQQIISFKNQTEIQVAGDRDLLFQCITNVLDNALKYAPDESCITLSLTHEDQQCHISVHDQGDGIPESEFHKVFERFYRVEKSRGLSGNGLGLSLVEAVINLHGGTIDLKNSDGFTIILSLPTHRH